MTIPYRPHNRHATHKYKRMENGLWRCRLPGCMHFMPHGTTDEDMVGKKTYCWKCDSEMILFPHQVETMVNPICTTCEEIAARAYRAKEDLMEEKRWHLNWIAENMASENKEEFILHCKREAKTENITYEEYLRGEHILRA